MNNKVAWIIVAVAVLAGAYFLFIREDVSAPTEQETVQENESVATAGTFRDLLESNETQRCTFADAESQSEGTVYVSQGRMRGDFNTQVDDEILNGHMIVKDNTFYMWMDGQSQGFRFSLEGEAETEMMDAELGDLDREVDYDCDNATVLDSQFDLPVGVTFTDFSQFSL